MQLLERERYEEAEDAGNHEVADHREEDDESEIDIAIEKGDHDAGDETGSGTIDDAEQDLLHEGLPVLLKRDLAVCELTDHDRHGLGAGIATHTGDDGHRRGEGDHLRDGRFKHLDSEGREERRQQVDQQPRQTHPYRFPEGRIETLLCGGTS